jgi:hypothetical protein
MKTKTRALRLSVAGAVLAAVCFGVANEAQAWVEWKRQLGTEKYDGASSVATDAFGNIYLTGETWGSLGGLNRGSFDAWIAKYDGAGRLHWKRQLGTEMDDYVKGVASDTAGNVYLTGFTNGSLVGPNRGWADAWVAKYEAAGTLKWKRQLGTEKSEVASGVATDPAGNVYLTGEFSSPMGGPYDAWVAKYDAAGSLKWKRQLGTKYIDYATGVAADSAGNVYIAGGTEGSLGGPYLGAHDAWIAKYDSAGTLKWKRQLGTVDDEEARGVATDVAGNIYLTGSTSGALGGPIRGFHDAWVAKYDAAGSLKWKRQVGTETEDDDYATGVAADSVGNVYLTGLTYGSLGGPNRGSYDAWIAKYDTAGTLKWKWQLGTEFADFACSVATDAAGDVYLAGATDGSLGGRQLGDGDAWVVKLGPRE